VGLSVVATGADAGDSTLLSISELGFGKQTKLSEYPQQGRGGQGVITLRVTEKTGELVALNSVQGGEDLFVLTKGGILIRSKVDRVQTYGRASQGVTVIKLSATDRVVQAMLLPADDQVALAASGIDTAAEA
jgi:DNA gyrase subunit A